MEPLSNGPLPLSREGRDAAGGGGPLPFSMDAKRLHPSRDISHYEGLVRKTAAECATRVEDDFDEICQFLREKVWKALDAFSTERVKTLRSKYTPEQQRERFVFACVTNGKKDVLKKKQRGWLFIDDLATSLDDDKRVGDPNAGGFALRYLCEDDAFTSFESDEPRVPNILDPTEREVALLLYENFNEDEIAAKIGRRRKETRAVIAGIQQKMVEFAPEEWLRKQREAQATAPPPAPVAIAA